MKAGIDYQKDVSLKGLQTDFFVQSADGRRLAVELKRWRWFDNGNVARAASLSSKMSKQIKTDEVFIVLDGIKNNHPSRNVYKVDGITGAVEQWLAKSKGRRKVNRAFPGHVERKIFAAMPFAGKYDDTFLTAIRYAADAVNATAVRTDSIHFSGDIVQKIGEEIRESTALVVDFSEAKANVMFEAGFAHALGKPCAHISSTPTGKLPFDVNHLNIIHYEIGQTNALKRGLADRLEAVLAGS